MNSYDGFLFLFLFLINFKFQSHEINVNSLGNIFLTEFSKPKKKKNKFQIIYP